MNNIWKWILFGAAVFLVAFCIALPLLGGLSGMPVRALYGFGMMDRGMMSWGYDGSGWIGILSRLAIPVLGVVGLAALVYYLVKRPSTPPPPPPFPTTPCANCGKPLVPGWVACPYCGKKQK